jgi:hypothetical protein
VVLVAESAADGNGDGNGQSEGTENDGVEAGRVVASCPAAVPHGL